MIKSIKVLSGFAANLPAVKDRKFEFTEGLNILYGPNGCGKSTLLRIMSAYSLIPDRTGGWSRLKPLSTYNLSTKEYPHYLATQAPGKCTADVEWNGKPTFIYDASKIDSSNVGHLMFDKEESPDGLTGFDEQLSQMWGHTSQGRLNFGKFVKVWDELLKWEDVAVSLIELPEIVTKWPDTHNGQEHYNKDEYVNMLNYVVSNYDDKPITVLLDEPDRSLDIPLQLFFWKSMVARLSKRVQVIVACHNPLVLLGDVGGNIINMGETDYIDQSSSYIADFIANTLDVEELKTYVTSVLRSTEAPAPVQPTKPEPENNELIPGKYLNTMNQKTYTMVTEDAIDNVCVKGEDNRERWITKKFFKKWYRLEKAN